MRPAAGHAQLFVPAAGGAAADPGAQLLQEIRELAQLLNREKVQYFHYFPRAIAQMLGSAKRRQTFPTLKVKRA